MPSPAPRALPHRAVPLGRRAALLASLVAAVTAAALASCSTQPPGTPAGPTAGPSGPAPTTSEPPTSPPGSAPATTPARPASDVATNLSVPWSVVVLPDGSALVSERDTATVKRVVPGSPPQSLGRVPGVVPNGPSGGEGGLLGLAVDTKGYSADPVVYAYYSAESDNRVAAIPVSPSGSLGTPKVILTGIPGGQFHNGGRLAFGPDGFLYVSTGDSGERAFAQNLTSLGGKILRVTTAGVAAPGNPFGDSRVWSYGHRNVQGMVWDSKGTMYATEFGQNTWDELNIIRPGANYGWPMVEGLARRQGLVDPVRQWRTDEASPSGLTIGADGALYMAALRGRSLWRIPLGPDGRVGEPQRLLEGTYGRLRDVVPGPDGRLWVLTNNTARGTPRAGDDRVVSLDPAALP
ncbi:MAG: PQQ-dependent sugar dehydrogenase [Lapillicoccus sp.]